MRITKDKNGELYLVKNRGTRNPFEWRVRHDGNTIRVMVGKRTVTCPKELVGKRIRFKVEVV